MCVFFLSSSLSLSLLRCRSLDWADPDYRYQRIGIGRKLNIFFIYFFFWTNWKSLLHFRYCVSVCMYVYVCECVCGCVGVLCVWLWRCIGCVYYCNYCMAAWRIRILIIYSRKWFKKQHKKQHFTKVVQETLKKNNYICYIYVYSIYMYIDIFVLCVLFWLIDRSTKQRSQLFTGRIGWAECVQCKTRNN